MKWRRCYVSCGSGCTPCRLANLQVRRNGGSGRGPPGTHTADQKVKAERQKARRYGNEDDAVALLDRFDHTHPSKLHAVPFTNARGSSYMSISKGKINRVDMHGNCDPVLESLVAHAKFIVDSSVGEGVGLDAWYKLFEVDLDINFDCTRFFLTSEHDNLSFPITRGTPVELKRVVLGLVLRRAMKENIKNKHYRLHFRGYQKRTLLEDTSCRLRCALFLHLYAHTGDRTRTYLLHKLCDIRSAIAKEKDDELIATLQTTQTRLEAVLQTIEEHTSLRVSR